MRSPLIFPLVVVLLILPLAANAQYDFGSDPAKSNWNIHVEGAIVGNTGGGASELESRMSDSMLSAGFGYETPTRGNDCKSWLGISFDYIPVADVFTGELTTDDVTLIPALIYYRKGWSMGNSMVWGAIGPGIRWAENDIPEMKIEKGTDLIASLQVGMDFTRSVFTEIRYFQGSHGDDDSFITGGIGFRF